MADKIIPISTDMEPLFTCFTVNGKRFFSAEEVREILTKKWQKEFGELRDETVGRDGYFVIGFVNNALKDK